MVCHFYQLPTTCEPPSLPLTISLSQQVPIYFSGGMASRANLYYRLLINWTNSQVQNPASRHSAFTFPHTLPWERSLLNAEVRIREESTIPCLQSQLYEPRKSRHTDSVAGMQSIPDAGPYLGPLPGSRPILYSPALASLLEQGPCVLFATPGMLHGGTSLEAFKAWADNPLNLVILPGYQVG